MTYSTREELYANIQKTLDGKAFVIIGFTVQGKEIQAVSFTSSDDPDSGCNKATEAVMQDVCAYLIFGNTSGKKAGTHWMIFMKPGLKTM
jgi:hypothetical protein